MSKGNAPPTAKKADGKNVRSVVGVGESGAQKSSARSKGGFGIQSVRAVRQRRILTWGGVVKGGLEITPS